MQPNLYAAHMDAASAGRPLTVLWCAPRIHELTMDQRGAVLAKLARRVPSAARQGFQLRSVLLTGGLRTVSDFGAPLRILH